MGYPKIIERTKMVGSVRRKAKRASRSWGCAPVIVFRNNWAEEPNEIHFRLKPVVIRPEAGGYFQYWNFIGTWPQSFKKFVKNTWLRA